VTEPPADTPPAEAGESPRPAPPKETAAQRRRRLAAIAKAADWRRAGRFVAQFDWRRTLTTFVTGLIVLGLMRVPAVERSILGQPDREMLDAAFELRADLPVEKADPVLLFDIDDRTIAGEPSYDNLRSGPSATAPRGVIADTLGFILASPPDRMPAVVMMDVDLATPTPGQEEGMAKMRAVLAAWASDPNAPPLLLAREAFPPHAIGVPGDVLALPDSPYDDIIEPAPNIFWVTVKVYADLRGIIREFVPYECVQTTDGIKPLYSVALVAYGFLEGEDIPKSGPFKDWTDRAEVACRERPAENLGFGERINYNLSFETDFETRAWPDLPPEWPGFKTCGQGDTSTFRRVSVIDIAEAGPDAGRDILCRRFVIIGGTNVVAGDWQYTPLDEMAGPVIIANAVRGLQMSNGGMRQVPWFIQIGVLFAVSVGISAVFALSAAARARYKRGRQAEQLNTMSRLKLLPLNPLVLNAALAFATHWLGIGLLLISLGLGYWGYLSAPAFAAAVMEAIQEFADD
jgi:hypothetical protein